MAEEKDSESGEVKKKLPIVPILLGVLIVLVVAIGAVFATLMMTNSLSDNQLESELDAIESSSRDAESGASPELEEVIPAEPKLMATPNPTRLDTLYYEMARPLTANLTASRKVMQVTVAIMTHYDQMVVDNIMKHELSIRSAMLTVLSNTPEEDLLRPNFREELGEKLRITINSVLEEFEDFGGVEAVFFSEFLVQ
jgi:flagellar FliL protein